MIEVYHLNNWLASLGKASIVAPNVTSWVNHCKAKYKDLNMADKLVVNKDGDIGVYLQIPIQAWVYKVTLFNEDKAYTKKEFVAQLQTTKVEYYDHIKVQLEAAIHGAATNGLDLAEIKQCLLGTSYTKNPEGLVEKIKARFSYAVKLSEAGKVLNIHLFHQTFSKAREMQRRLVAVLGPTNSGKTFEAFSALAACKKGVYLAPLRLMALEGYDKLSGMGLDCKLLTGEERIGSLTASHTSSTVEMFNPMEEYDIAVIDEIQMLGDPDRGWAWTNAILGVRAKEVYLLGAPEFLHALKYCAALTGEKLEVVEKKRLCPLKVQPNPEHIKGNHATAYICFSRQAVLNVRQRLGKKCAVIYGSLGPEVRKAQAGKFAKGELTTLASTDAIGMGLNLPIERIVFTEVSKWDGKKTRLLTPTEVKQIAGRAGRYGQYPIGYVSATNHSDLTYINSCINSPQAQGDNVLWIAPHLSMLKYLSKLLGTTNLYALITAFKAIKLKGSWFERSNLDVVSILATQLNKQCDALPISTQFSLCLAPININNDEHIRIWASWQANVANNKANQVPQKHSHFNLSEAEEFVKVLSAYKWMHYKLPSLFPEFEVAVARLVNANKFILECLMSQNISKH